MTPFLFFIFFLVELKYLLCFSWAADIITELLQSVCLGGLTGGNREGELN